jgi:hypothetical protein
MNIDERADADREEKIRLRAHEIWEREGRPAGRAELHWEQARREIEGEAARSQSSKQRAGLSVVSSAPKSRAHKRG